MEEMLMNVWLPPIKASEVMVDVRGARKDDRKIIRRILEHEGFRHRYPKVDVLKRDLKNYVVLIENRKIGGIIGLMKLGKKKYVMRHAWLASDFRNEGKGKLLAKRCMEKAKDLGATELSAFIRQDTKNREVAIGILKELGFRVAEDKEAKQRVKERAAILGENEYKTLPTVLVREL